MAEQEQLASIKAQYATICGGAQPGVWQESPNGMITLFDAPPLPRSLEDSPSTRDSQKCLPHGSVVRRSLDRTGRIILVLVTRSVNNQTQQQPLILGEGSLKDYQQGLPAVRFLLEEDQV